jgi:molecular chaperone DnaK (HSP70)
MVREMLRRLSGKDPDDSQSPDEVVAHGAALYARMLTAGSKSTGRPKYNLINVNSHSLGVVGFDPRTGHRINAILIPKNTSLPCRAVKKFKTARPGQATVKVGVVEGENRRPDQGIALGKCVVRDLPPDLPKGTTVEVEYCYASNGRISVSARVPSARQSASVEFQRDRSRDLEDLEAWRRRLCSGWEQVPIPEGIESLLDSQSSSPDDPSSLRNRLDELYVWAGACVSKLDVPPELQQARQSAVSAGNELRRAEEALNETKALQQAAAGPRETAVVVAKVSQARQAAQHARSKTQYAYLALGRESVDAGFLPPVLSRHIDEIVELRKRLTEQ